MSRGSPGPTSAIIRERLMTNYILVTFASSTVLRCDLRGCSLRALDATDAGKSPQDRHPRLRQLPQATRSSALSEVPRRNNANTDPVQCDTATPTCSSCSANQEPCCYSTPARKRGPRARSASALETEERAAASPSSLPLSILVTSPNPSTRVSFTSASGVGTAALGRYNADYAFHDIWCGLLTQLAVLWGSAGARYWTECIELYMRHLFPITPLVDEALLRLIALSLQTPGAAGPPAPNASSPKPSGPCGGQQSSVLEALAGSQAVQDMANGDCAAERALTLLTGLAATVATLMPEHLVPGPLHVSAGVLLTASRLMLRSFEDSDIDRPCATSVIIRYFHSLCAHAAGNFRMAWYTLGQAIRIAQDLRVHDEASLVGLHPHEAHLRRTIFWQLCTGDKSSAILNGRPLAFSPSCFQKPFSTLPLNEFNNPVMDATQARDNSQLAPLVNGGFNIIAEMFGRASVVLALLRNATSQSTRPDHVAELATSDVSGLMPSLTAFITLINELPDWLQRPWQYETRRGTGNGTADYCQTYVWVLYTNVMLTYYCLRLVLLVEADRCGLVGILGYSSDPELLALHKLDITRCALEVIRGAPFDALQVNGESSVEKIRHVGAILLEILQSSVGTSLADRAKKLFEEILDYLARLDSKASDALVQLSNAA